MKGSKHPANDVTINPSGNESILEVIARTPIGRRDFMKSTLALSAAAAVGSMLPLGRTSAAPVPPNNGFGGIGFDSIPPSTAPVLDAVTVPPGYKVEVLVAWGDPIMPGAPAWLEDATQTAADQEKQYGMHNDGTHYFPFPSRNGPASDRGVMCINNEYTHEEILHGPAGLISGVTIAKVRKSQAAHGVSILEVRKTAGKWASLPTLPTAVASPPIHRWRFPDRLPDTR